jgi:tryptophan synthase alpha chain
LDRPDRSWSRVGIPFSDPIADGPVIAASMHDAIKDGASPAGVLEEVASVRASLSAGLVAMVSASIVHRMGGAAGFAKRAAQAGFDGLIVPDLPLEESAPLIDAAGATGLTLSLMIAPTTPLKRAQDIAKGCTGFVYLLARTGITGENSEVPDLSGRIEKLRSNTPLPIAVGFGISSPAHVRTVVRHADAAIVGSALVRRISEAHGRNDDPAGAAARFFTELAAGLPSPASSGPSMTGVVQS